MKILILVLLFNLAGCSSTGFSTVKPSNIIEAPTLPADTTSPEVLELEAEAHEKLKKIFEGFMPSHSLL